MHCIYIYGVGVISFFLSDLVLVVSDSGSIDKTKRTSQNTEQGRGVVLVNSVPNAYMSTCICGLDWTEAKRPRYHMLRRDTITLHCFHDGRRDRQCRLGLSHRLPFFSPTPGRTHSRMNGRNLRIGLSHRLPSSLTCIWWHSLANERMDGVYRLSHQTPRFPSPLHLLSHIPG